MKKISVILISLILITFAACSNESHKLSLKDFDAYTDTKGENVSEYGLLSEYVQSQEAANKICNFEVIMDKTNSNNVYTYRGITIGDSLENFVKQYKGIKCLLYYNKPGATPGTTGDPGWEIISDPIKSIDFIESETYGAVGFSFYYAIVDEHEINNFDEAYNLSRKAEPPVSHEDLDELIDGTKIIELSFRIEKNVVQYISIEYLKVDFEAWGFI